ncbi:MAG: hypothetical protein JNL96_16330 [Planctomycetaceae bacterium]|nr:hypothetical protein [Planctomycetaceae bacterium]
MPSGKMFLVFLLGGAFLPYLLSNSSGIRDAVTTQINSVTGGDEKAAAPKAVIAAAATSSPDAEKSAKVKATTVSYATAQAPAKPTGSRETFVTLEQALDWRVTPAWILGNWPRVTTHLSELDTQGYRVTLVTGTAQSDVAGALTYYFDPKQELKKITFNGTTGDAKALVQFLLARHRFERRMTADPSVYVYQVEQDGQALSELKIRTAPVVSAGNAYSRFELTLTMNRPTE